MAQSSSIGLISGFRRWALTISLAASSICGFMLNSLVRPTLVVSERIGIISRVFKKVTPRNWAERDLINANFVMPDKGSWRRMTGDDWTLRLGPLTHSAAWTAIEAFLGPPGQ
jgi:hypothetical protein